MILAVCSVVGIITEKIALGIVFVMSLFITLYGLFIPLQKHRITGLGSVIIIVGIMCLAYAICELFLGMDLKAVLGF